MYEFKFPFLLVLLALWVSIQFSLAELIPAVHKEFTLTASTNYLIHGVTQNFSLECAYNKDLDSSQLSLAEISRIRILKVDDSGQWKLVAEIRDNKVKVHLYDNIVGRGQIVGDLGSAYLNLTWPTVEVTTFGRYRCDVPGFDRNLDYAVERSDIVTLIEHNITAQDVLDLLLAEKNQFRHELDTAIKTVKLSNDEKLKTMNLSIGHKHEPWPEGTYSLLAPVTGCPHSSEWRKGYFKLHTESSRIPNSDFISKPSNLPPYTRFSDGGQNFMILTYCSKIKSTPGMPWPSGSYCVNKRGSCPAGFHSGYIGPDIENTYQRSNQGGYYPDSSSHFHLYCCRSDGPANKTITLPTADSFYLCRFYGRCQLVANMHVSVESVYIDTEDSKNGDEYENRYHPDGTLNPVEMELCHYRPLS